ncbi:MAG: threonylcarbamoyl-AMP synthase [Oscillospiraceae bacterium]|jgi:L-threonylcarbamoyladenylate synthase|nr:threonylcarbamoyl-AMP synthase [Oscillospiraceae bacterium]
MNKQSDCFINYINASAIVTRVLDGASGLDEAARLLIAGEIVAFPTETVYGLGADATQPAAVRKIFAAKGRPLDNPLIVHIADIGAWYSLAHGIDDRALSLAREFWPGPLTIVLPRTDSVSDDITAGLGTVGVRMPSHPLALELISRAGRPLAAPSANRSGKPSPTTAAETLADLFGIIPLILDGGPCSVGVESTVITLAEDPPVLLRPGGVTAERLRAIIPEMRIHPSALAAVESNQPVPSPGIRHRHYSPNAKLTLVTGSPIDQRASLIRLYDNAIMMDQHPILLVCDETADAISSRLCVRLGSRDNPETIARGLFGALREIDRQCADVAFGETYDANGIGLALMNRLLRAAGFRIEPSSPVR